MWSRKWDGDRSKISTPFMPPPQEWYPVKQGTETGVQQQGDVVAELVSLGVSESAASKIVESYPPGQIRLQLDCYRLRLEVRDWKNPAGMLRDSIEKNWAPPPSYQVKLKDAEKSKAKKDKAERDDYMREHEPAWHAYIDQETTRIEIEDPEGFYLFLESEEALRDEIRKMPMAKASQSFLERTLENFDSPTPRRERCLKFFNGRILNFWEWDETAC